MLPLSAKSSGDCRSELRPPWKPGRFVLILRAWKVGFAVGPWWCGNSVTEVADMEMTDKELQLLERIRDNSGVHQRDLARSVGVSLGMTNAILKRLGKKGLLTVRKINNRNIRYIVSPAGVEEIAKRSYRYLRRTMGNVVRYRKAVQGLVEEVKNRGFARVVLVGQSDLDFMLEHFCQKLGIGFGTAEALDDELAVECGTFRVLSERAQWDSDTVPAKGDDEREDLAGDTCHLARLLTRL